MISIKYIYSACITIKTPDIKVLCDPWFTEGAFEGSWYTFPKVKDSLGECGDCDAIYISHLHPDHYDPEFLKTYMNRYGEKPIWIADHSPNHFKTILQNSEFRSLFGVYPHDVDEKHGNTEVIIWPHDTGSSADIDSALIIKHGGDCVVNANDIAFQNGNSAQELKDLVGDIDIFMGAFTVAGPYPQTYYDADDPMLEKEAQEKKNLWLGHYMNTASIMDAKVNIPFAGKFVLGGKLVGLNKHRAVADQTEVLPLDDKAVVLETGGEINTKTLTPTKTRTKPYPDVLLQTRLREIQHMPLWYERDMAKDIKPPLVRLLISASSRAKMKSECEEDYYFVFDVAGKKIAVNANKNSNHGVVDFNDGLRPRSEIIIDDRYLYGLLTGTYHWNNAAVGSMYQVRRVPNKHNISAENFLNFLSVV